MSDFEAIQKIKDERPTIRLAGLDPQSTVNGVGIRALYFSQGCPHHCKGCFNPETWPFTKGKISYIDELMEDLTSWPYLDGVTFTGGDPFAQAKPFAIFAQQIKENTKLNIWAYTGYTWEELMKLSKKDESVKLLIAHVDVIMDGRFEKDKLVSECKNPNDYPFRGSTNQRAIDVQKSLKSKKVVLFTAFNNK